ncbi:tRNA lysidine(34) synthetase TilS [Micromonospora sp. 4G57]|uniref:tRNA(Ile)-lysidine synthase n=1 Tax=Micromonospora sicca TaxID=2202420 RepID=A0ABU5JFV1_9ACTN|nr:MULTISPECIES: tRNA lysidine(34) synthetase TilS [unclassified Micromonospora]MDZ5441212.1 tRNA lysidine(34) synthetase TilS [Micromonospora sp. 4G57]MDZ5491438.1 tRNA lysidine(34) synthetase TilS [Micromonospora sp. 4G53]
MAALAPPVAAVRVAVRRALAGLTGDGPVLVACSGGADSLALAAATAFVAPRLGRLAGLVTVDHGLQPGSAERADAVARWAAGIGLDPVDAVRVTVAGRPGGPEAAAREARYQALVAAARRHDAAALLLGHTRDDQAETVLLALARGAGPRGLAGMPERRELDGVPLLRPLLDVGRDDTRKACAALGLTPWEDPHNADPAYARARVRSDVLPALVRALGPGVLDNLARTARLVAADTAALDDLAAAALAAARLADDGLSVDVLVALSPAVRTRVLHAWARQLGAAPAALSHRHVAALDALVTGWHGQGVVHLPGGLRVARRKGRLILSDPR